jgi:hypothetical protein
VTKGMILKLGEQKWTKRDSGLNLSTFLFLKRGENLLNQGLELGMIFAI